MTHLDEEVMAQWALDGSEPEADAADHLATCPHCQETLAELRELSTELRQTPELSSPPTSVWDQISAELDLSPTTPAAGRTTQPGSSTDAPGSAGGDDSEPARRRGVGRGALALAASVAVFLGIGIGLGGAALFAGDESPTTPVAVVQLEPLPGKTGSGTADLIQPGNELHVSVTGLDAQTGFYELWLINSDGQRMVSLGVLDPRQAGTFHIPADMTSQGYLIVDVSLEPNDGNPVHSRDSVVRGTLPS
jgi:hypothetical protein